MAYLPGWAYSESENAKAAANRARYKELVGGGKITITNASPQYARTVYTGTADRAVSDHDILVFCDGGNACFGGEVNRSGDRFTASVYTD